MPRGRIPDEEGKSAALYALLLIIGLALMVGAMLYVLYQIGMAKPA